MLNQERRIAYFSMEIAVESQVPTYSGGLGILAGDTVRSAADLHVPMVAISLLARKGYFYQHLDGNGQQTEEPTEWNVSDYLDPIDATASVTIEGQEVRITAWRYDVTSTDGFLIPVFFLDANLPENSPDARKLTDSLYGGDDKYRLSQEVLLGIGGVRLLRAMGYEKIERFHLNEGHAALLTLELLAEQRLQSQRESVSQDDISAVRHQCVFTTHTPVPAGHDHFEMPLVEQVLGKRIECGIHDSFCHAGQLNLTYLALQLSHYVNGVAKKHSEVSQHMFAGYLVDAITNGVHAASWVSPSFAELFDTFMPHWQRDNFSLRYALSIPDNDIWQAHQSAKRNLLDYILQETSQRFDADTLTIGFARRATSYKRPELIFTDIDRLRAMIRDIGPIQIVFGGKAHPRDEEGKAIIRRIVQVAKTLGDELPVVYLANYDQKLGGLMTSGVDLWLNTPEPPLEASGTSGMKAAMNGVPSLSVLDGWWIEGCIDGVTGWPIGHRNGQIHGATADSLYEQLGSKIMPLFYHERSDYINVMRNAIAINGSFFNTQRMVHEYLVKSYGISPVT